MAIKIYCEKKGRIFLRPSPPLPTPPPVADGHPLPFFNYVAADWPVMEIFNAPVRGKHARTMRDTTRRVFLIMKETNKPSRARMSGKISSCRSVLAREKPFSGFSRYRRSDNPGRLRKQHIFSGSFWFELTLTLRGLCPPFRENESTVDGANLYRVNYDRFEMRPRAISLARALP